MGLGFGRLGHLLQFEVRPAPRMVGNARAVRVLQKFNGIGRSLSLKTPFFLENPSRSGWFGQQSWRIGTAWGSQSMAEFISNSAILPAIRPLIRAYGEGSDRSWSRKMAEFRIKSATTSAGSRSDAKSQIVNGPTRHIQLLAGLTFDSSQYLAKGFLDVTLRKPDLLNTVHVREQLSSVLNESDSSSES